MKRTRFVALILPVLLVVGFATKNDEVLYQTLPLAIPELPAGYIDHSYDDKVWLAKNIYFESRGEPIQGQLGVAFVTVNRWKHKDFPSDSIKSVVTQKRNKVCQFSWFCSLNPNDTKDVLAWNKSLVVAEHVLSGRAINPVGDSIFFKKAKKNRVYKPHELVISRHVFSPQLIRH